MKAAILKNVNDLRIENLQMPKCGSDEILIEVKAAAICATDKKMILHGHKDLTFPRILGHEIAGIISKTGKNVKKLKIGNRVQISPGVVCGTCFYCREKHENMCDNMKIIGFHINGGFSQYLHIPQKGIAAGVINSIPKNLTFEEACLAEPLACCINALTLGNLSKGENIVIFGAGPIGCLLIQVSRLFGAEKIILVEPNKQRLEFAKQFNADYYIHDFNKNVFSTIKEKLKRTVNILISACSHKKIPQWGIDILSKRGRIVFFSGIKQSYTNIPINYNLIHYKELSVIGAYGCTSKQNKTALSLIHKKLINVKSLITHYFCLDEIEKGLSFIKNKEGMKIIINKF
ncbi:MAG: alcohol dehydrogenase catalytic domain-containing protein [Candidatus Omnitrophota bacterium]|nr:alcohol dehydrogenase catalytic domain-containing protein [Candidatus Omnitrophota bacterium]